MLLSFVNYTFAGQTSYPSVHDLLLWHNDNNYRKKIMMINNISYYCLLMQELVIWQCALRPHPLILANNKVNPICVGMTEPWLQRWDIIIASSLISNDCVQISLHDWCCAPMEVQTMCVQVTWKHSTLLPLLCLHAHTRCVKSTHQVLG